MSTYEHNTLMQYKDQNGDMHLTYPVTKAENVDGLYGDAALTGVPTAPTASSGTNTTQIATTAFVHQELEGVKATIPEEPDLTAYAKTSDLASVATSGSYNDLTDKPTIPEEPDLTAYAKTSDLASVATSGSYNDLTDKPTIPEEPDLTAYAPLASPTLTGTPKAPTAAKGTNTTQIATTAYVQTEVADLKKSVSDGKTLVATAITDKGVDTAADATFAVMAANVRAIKSSGGIGLNIFTQETEPETKEGIWIQTANPHQSAVVGSTKYENSVGYDGVEWEKLYDGSFPYGYPYGYSVPLVVFDNKIYHLNVGNTDPTEINIYDINTGLWTRISGNIGGYPKTGSISYSAAVVYKNEIHMLGGIYRGNDTSYTKYHYKYDGTSWSNVSTLPYSFYNGCAVVYNDEIHILGSKNSSHTRDHYKYDGTSWSKVSTLPYSFYNGRAVVYNDEIHILGSQNGSYTKYHYKYDGTSWSKVSTLPYDFYNGCAVVYHNEIHILGGYYAPEARYHYKFDGTNWESVTTLPYVFCDGGAVVYNDEIHILNSSKTPYRFHYRIRGKSVIESCNGTKIAIYQNPNNAAGVYATNFISGVPITGENNKFPSGFDDVYYIDDSGNVEESPTYYGNGTQWIKLKN